MSDLAIFVGRFHPLVVHLPIGALLLLAVAEAVGYRRPSWRLAENSRRVILVLVILSAALAAGCGWLLGQEGDYAEELVDRHRNLGFVTLGLTVVLLIVHPWPRFYGWALAATLMVLGWTGHNGGSLTHGPGYLAEYAPGVLRPLLGGGAAARPAPTDLAEVEVFHDVVQPVLAARCVSCHGETRTDGDLRLDSFEAISSGGKNGAVLVAEETGESTLLQRLYLPLSHDEHMPPAGRPQPTDEELAVLEWWLRHDAPGSGRFMDLALDPELVEGVARQLGLPPPPVPERATMIARARELEVELGITIRPLTAEGPWLAGSARLGGEAFDDAALAALAPVASALHRLDLGGTAISDQGLEALAGMTELRRLQLDQTAVTDEGLRHLSPLRRLESLSLHTTAVTDAGMMELSTLRKLRRLFLWQTAVTPAAANELATRLENRRQLNRYEREISDRQRRIYNESFQADFGATITVVPPTKSD